MRAMLGTWLAVRRQMPSVYHGYVFVAGDAPTVLMLLCSHVAMISCCHAVMFDVLFPSVNNIVWKPSGIFSQLQDDRQA